MWKEAVVTCCMLHVRWKVARGEVFTARYELRVGNIIRLIWVVFKGLLALGGHRNVSLLLAVCSLHSWPAFWAGYYLARFRSSHSGGDASLSTDFAVTYAYRQQNSLLGSRGGY
jgi:hypothetical protein